MNQEKNQQVQSAIEKILKTSDIIMDKDGNEDRTGTAMVVLIMNPKDEAPSEDGSHTAGCYMRSACDTKADMVTLLEQAFRGSDNLRMAVQVALKRIEDPMFKDVTDQIFGFKSIDKNDYAQAKAEEKQQHPESN